MFDGHSDSGWEKECGGEMMRKAVVPWVWLVVII